MAGFNFLYVPGDRHTVGAREWSRLTIIDVGRRALSSDPGLSVINLTDFQVRGVEVMKRQGGAQSDRRSGGRATHMYVR